MKTNRARIAVSILAVLLILIVVVNSRPVQKVETVETIRKITFKVLEEKNPSSFGYNIRISAIRLDNDAYIDLEQYAGNDGWIYGYDASTLGHYDKGSSELTIPVEATSISIATVKNCGSGMVEIYLNDELVDTYDMYAEQWEDIVLNLQKTKVEVQEGDPVMELVAIVLSVITLVICLVKRPMKSGKKAPYYCVALISLAVAFQFTLYAPLELYLSNMDEFWFGLNHILPISAGTFLTAFAVLMLINSGIYFLIPSICPTALLVEFAAFMTGYFQGNFLVQDLPPLDGTTVQWADLYHRDIATVAIFLTVLAIVTLMVRIFQNREKTAQYTSMAAAGISLMLAVTLLTLFLTKGFGHDNAKLVVSTENKEVYSEDQNFVILLLDAVDAMAFEDLLTDNPQYASVFDDFTFYRDTLAAYPYTSRSIPFIWGGYWYENEMMYSDYLVKSVNESPLFQNLRDNGYQMNLYYADIPLYASADYQQFSNLKAIPTTYSSVSGMIRGYLSLGGVKYAPYALKRSCYNCIYDLPKLCVMLESNVTEYSSSNQEFYQNLGTEALTIQDEKQFKFLYLEGGHVPFKYDEQVNIIENGTYEDNLRACVTIVNAYLQKLKDSGVYDNSVIVILADHGYFGDRPEGMLDYRQNPILFVKGIQEKHDFTVSDAPISYADLQEGFSNLLQGKTGDEVFGIPENTNRERRFLYYLYLFENDMEEYIQTGHVWDADSLAATGKRFTR